MRLALGLFLAGLIQISQLELDYADPDEAQILIRCARLSEIEWAEDVNREAMWQAFGGCSGRPDAEACRARERERFGRDLDAVRAAMDAKYERILKDFESRCHGAIT